MFVQLRWTLMAGAILGVVTTAGDAWPAKRPAQAAPAATSVVPAEPKIILEAIRRPGATAVLVNVWATWCDACREEMPRLLKFFREHRRRGLRLVLVSADDETERDRAAQFLAAQGMDIPSWLKRGDDMAFIDALDRRWTGALPASLLFDGKGRVVELWQRPVTVADLEHAWSRIVPADPPPSSAQPPTPSGRNP